MEERGQKRPLGNCECHILVPAGEGEQGQLEACAAQRYHLCSEFPFVQFSVCREGCPAAAPDGPPWEVASLPMASAFPNPSPAPPQPQHEHEVPG